MNDQIKIQLCRDDFYLMLRNAVLQSGGVDKVEDWKRMKFEDVVNALAHNGLRITFAPEKHMNSINILWQDNSKKLVRSPRPTLPSNVKGLPTKKQLLCDRFDSGEEDETCST